MNEGYVYELAKKQAEEIIARSLMELKIEYGDLIGVDTSKGNEFGIISSTISFSLSKIMKKSPNEIALQIKEIANKFLEKNEIDKRLFKKIDCAAGYLNFFGSDFYYSQAISQAARMSGEFGKSQNQNKIRYVVEFSSPNLGKPLHIGHIRGTVLGDSICNLLSSQLATVIRMNYPADAGTQIAQLIVAMRNFKDILPATDEMGLYEYYRKINEEIEKEPRLKEEANQVGMQIENGSKEIMQDLENINKVSFSALTKNYQLLSVNFDVVATESQFIQPGKQIVEECLEKGIAKKENDGSVVALLEDHGLSNTLLLKSNGTTLYFTRDLALADFKFSTLHFDNSLILTAMEQNLHFKQVKKMLELLQRPYFSNYNHMGFGLVFLKNAKMSTREGNVIFLKEVLNQAINQSVDEITKRKPEYDKEQVQEIANVLGVGALKFAFLKVSPERNMNFDPVASAQFEGDTGPYVQYTAVRAANIILKLNEISNFKNLEISGISKEFLWSLEETELVQMIAIYPSVLHSAAKTQSPHVICDYLLKLAACFSKFYESKKVIEPSSPIETHSRAIMVIATYNVLLSGLAILGIKVPVKM